MKTACRRGTPLGLLALFTLAFYLWSSPALAQDETPPSDSPPETPSASPSGTPMVPDATAVQRLPQLPSGPVEVTVLELAAPSRYVELTRQFQVALDEQAEWLQGYLQENSTPGEPLPWHENFGLTEEEYAELLDLADEVRLRPVRKATLEIVREDPWISFKAADGVSDGLGALNDVTLDLGQRKVTTPFGDCANFVAVSSEMDTRAAEPWNGMTCQRTQGDPQGSAQIVAFSLGKYAEDDAVFLSYEGKKIQNGTFVDRADVFLSIP